MGPLHDWEKTTTGPWLTLNLLGILRRDPGDLAPRSPRFTDRVQYQKAAINIRSNGTKNE
jgi:hypothetical protein